MTNPKNEVLEENVARFIREGALSLTEGQMRKSFREFLDKVRPRATSERPEAPGRGGLRRAGLPAIAASFICLAAVGWFMLPSSISREKPDRPLVGALPGEATQEKTQERTIPGVSARALGDQIFDAVKKFRDSQAAQKRGGQDLALELESLDIRQTPIFGNETFTVDLRGRICNLDYLSELRKELKKVELLKNVDYKGPIGPLKAGSVPFTLSVSERVQGKMEAAKPPSTEDDVLRFLSSKAAESGLPPEALTYRKNSPLRLGDWLETSYVVNLRTERPNALPVTPGEPAWPKVEVSRVKFMDFLRRLESGGAGLTARTNLSMIFAGDLVTEASVMISSFARP